MATYEDIVREIVEFHEKLKYDENPSIRPRVLDAVNRAIIHVWSKADWTFRVQTDDITYAPGQDSNPLPENFLAFHHTGQVIIVDEADRATSELQYMPFNQMLGLLKGINPEQGTPAFYSLGGPLDGVGNRRSIFLYPKPLDTINLRLIYQATPVLGTIEALTDNINSIPINWHKAVLKEVAILFRLMDKSADTTVQAALVKTALDAMMRDEPHGREDTPKVQPAYAWRMNVRFS